MDCRVKPGNDDRGCVDLIGIRSGQTLNCAALIHSQKFAPGGFCRSAAYMVSKLPSVTKSYLVLWVVKPWTKVCSAMWSLRHEPWPPRLSTERPTIASITSSCEGQLPLFAFDAF